MKKKKKKNREQFAALSMSLSQVASKWSDVRSCCGCLLAPGTEESALFSGSAEEASVPSVSQSVTQSVSQRVGTPPPSSSCCCCLLCRRRRCCYPLCLCVLSLLCPLKVFANTDWMGGNNCAPQTSLFKPQSPPPRAAAPPSSSPSPALLPPSPPLLLLLLRSRRPANQRRAVRAAANDITAGQSAKSPAPLSHWRV